MVCEQGKHGCTALSQLPSPFMLAAHVVCKDIMTCHKLVCTQYVKRMAGGCMVCCQAVRYLGHITVATIVASSSKVAVCNSTRGDTHRE